MFFAYLRSLSPDQAVTGVTMVPRSLEKLLNDTEYPPQRSDLLASTTNKVVMIVDSVSPTPFALLRRANHFQYRDEDQALQDFSEYDDPVQALTDECQRVLKSISSANQSQVSSTKHSTSLRDVSWSRFEDIGFASALEEEDEDDDSALAARRKPQPGLRRTPASGNGLGRPTTPSWADFLSSGFMDENQAAKSNLLLPPDKVLPPLEIRPRQRSSQSHRPRLEHDRTLEPGELASITTFDLDDAFWWVWMTSLAPEETAERKSAFGRCAVIETNIVNGRWLVMEEMVAGAAPEPQEGAYLAEKKGFFSWTRRGKGLSRRKSTGKHALDPNNQNASKASIGPDTHARIQAKAAQLRAADLQEKKLAAQQHLHQRRGRTDAELMAEKTNSVFTLQPIIIGEASSALKWVSKYDKGTIKDAYLSNDNAGRGTAVSPISSERPNGAVTTNGGSHDPEHPPDVPVKDTAPRVVSPTFPASPKQTVRKALPAPLEQPEPKSEPVQEPEPSPLPVPEPEPEQFASMPSPMPPPKDERAHDIPRENMVSPTSSSPENKKPSEKLQKDTKENRGFRKLFRKGRSSKLPDNAASDLNGMLQRDQPTPEPLVKKPLTPAETPEPIPAPVAAPVPVPSGPSATPQATESEMPTPIPAAEFVTPMEEPAQRAITPPQAPEIREPTMDEAQLPVDTKDSAATEAQPYSFSQGPLADQPAFIPDSDDEDDDATPPPITREPRQSPQLESTSPEEKLSHSAGPGVQDRWAQIRKNAAERTSNLPVAEPGRYRQSKNLDNEDDTSGEESR